MVLRVEAAAAVWDRKTVALDDDAGYRADARGLVYGGHLRVAKAAVLAHTQTHFDAAAGERKDGLAILHA